MTHSGHAKIGDLLLTIQAHGRTLAEWQKFGATVMPGITTEFLFKIALEVPILALGETPYGQRRVARFETAASRALD